MKNKIKELSLYVTEYITLVNKILNIYFKNNIIKSIILSCLENNLHQDIFKSKSLIFLLK